MLVLFASFLASKEEKLKNMIKSDVKFLFQESQLTLIDSCSTEKIFFKK